MNWQVFWGALALMVGLIGGGFLLMLAGKYFGCGVVIAALLVGCAALIGHLES